MIFDFEHRRLFFSETGPEPRGPEVSEKKESTPPLQEVDPLKETKADLRALATMPTQDPEEKGVIQQALDAAKGKYDAMRESVVGSVQEQVNTADKWFAEKAEEMVQGAETLAPMIAKAYGRMTPEQRAPIDHYLHQVDDRLKTEYGSSLKEVSEFFENMPPEEREKLAKDLIPGSDLKDAWNGDKLSAVFLVAAIFPWSKVGKLARTARGLEKVEKTAKREEPVNTEAIPGMTDAKIKPHEIRKFLQDETGKLGDIPKLSPENARTKFDEILGNIGVIVRYIKNADNNPVLSASERVSAKEALKDEVVGTLEKLEEGTRGVRTFKQEKRLSDILNQLTN